MANPTFAMTTIGVLLLAGLSSTGTAHTASDLLLISPGETLVLGPGVNATSIDVAGTLVLQGPVATLQAHSLVVRPGGRIEGAHGLPAAAAEQALQPAAGRGTTLHVHVERLVLEPGSAILGGAGAHGVSVFGMGALRAGDGGDGGSVVITATHALVEGIVLGGGGGSGGDAVATGPDAHAVAGDGGDAGLAVLNGQLMAQANAGAPHPRDLVAYVQPFICKPVLSCLLTDCEEQPDCAPGLPAEGCAQPQGAPGEPNAAGKGGDGGDACASGNGADGRKGPDGNSGIFECSDGGAGTPGTSAFSVTATGGNGGFGTTDGGRGGSANAQANGGSGGNGGTGGTKWGDNCAGGNGGAGGNGASATANGGNGGNGLCGAGGAGGGAQASAEAGRAGGGGAGDPPGLPGAPGSVGSAAANGGSLGTGLDACPKPADH